MRIDTALRSCDPSVNYSQVTIRTSNKYLWGEFFPCLERGWSSEQVDSALTAAYIEGIRARPDAAIYNWFGWTSVELGTRVRYDPSQSGCNPASYTFCDEVLALERDAPPALKSSASAWSQAWDVRMAPVRQVYLLPVFVTKPPNVNDPYGTMGRHALSARYVLLIWLTCVAVLALLYFRTRGSVRLLGLSAAAVIGYVCLTSVVGAVYLARYISVLSPIDAVLSAILIFVALRLVADLALWLGARIALMAAASAVALTVIFYLLIPPPALALVDASAPTSTGIQLLGYGLTASLLAIGAAVVIRLRGRQVRTPDWKWPVTVDEAGV
jgi:hypothetical protein